MNVIPLSLPSAGAAIGSIVIALAAISQPVRAQQIVDTEIDLTVANPRWPQGQGPVIVIDEGHHNFHTAGGRYAPFASLLRSDGYVIRTNDQPFTAEALSGTDVLVIANARGEPIGDLRTVMATALTPDEIAAVREWVASGGALFLIADHAPFPSAIALLAAVFGVHWDNVYAAQPNGNDVDLFTTASGALATDGPIQSADRPVRQIRSFTGSAFLTPPSARVMARLGERWAIYVSDENDQISEHSPRLAATGKAQLATLAFGRGRIVFAGEAAMFTAQMFGPEREREGLGSPGAEDNRAALLNLVGWLASAGAAAVHGSE